MVCDRVWIVRMRWVECVLAAAAGGVVDNIAAE